MKSLLRDPRHYQITLLSSFVVLGLAWFARSMPLYLMALTIGGVLVIQFALTKAFKVPRFDPRSAMITGLSLCLLIRPNVWWIVLLAAAIAIGSKFLIRVKNAHIFNPANFAVAILLLLTTGDFFAPILTERALDISPGQWGSGMTIAFLLAGLGFIVSTRAARCDISLAFLGFYALIVFGLAVYLGDPMSIPMKRMLNGTLMIFAFFMISDPKTTPDSRWGRMLFAAMAALLTCEMQYNLSDTFSVFFGYHERVSWYWGNRLVAHAPFYALLVCSCTLPLINQLAKAPKYMWPGTREPEPVAALERS